MSFDAKESGVYSGEPFELYRFAMGTVVWTYTSGDTAITYNAEVYEPEAIERAEIEQNRELESSTIQIEMPLTTVVAQQFIMFTPPDPVWLTIYAGHHGDSEVIVRFSGKIEQATLTDICKLRVRSTIGALRKRIPGPTYQQACNRMLYSDACGASMDGNGVYPAFVANHWTFKVGAIGADGVTISVDQGASESSSFVSYWGTHFSDDPTTLPRLDWGKLVAPTGHQMMIGSHSSAYQLVLKGRVPQLAVGDVVTVYRGCRRTLAHCNFYGRTHRFMGFDIQPGKNPFSGV